LLVSIRRRGGKEGKWGNNLVMRVGREQLKRRVVHLDLDPERPRKRTHGRYLLERGEKENKVHGGDGICGNPKSRKIGSGTGRKKRRAGLAVVNTRKRGQERGQRARRSERK